MDFIEVIKLIFGILSLFVILCGAYYSYKMSEKEKFRARAWMIISLGFTIGFFLHFIDLNLKYINDSTGFIGNFLYPVLYLLVSFAFSYGIYLMTKSNEPRERNRKNESSLFVTIASIVILLSATLVIFGWIYHIQSLLSVTAWFPSMKLPTAIAFISSSIILFLINRYGFEAKTLTKLSINLLAIFIIIVIFSFVFINSGEELVGGVLVGNKPSIGTIISFIIFSFAALLFNFNKNNYKKLTYFGIGLIILPLIALVGFITNIPTLYFDIPGLSGGMAVHTLGLLLLLGTSLIVIGRRSKE